MKKRLSTSLTIFWKFIFPVIWVIVFGGGTIGAMISSKAEGLAFLIAFIFGFILFYYLVIRAKIVHIDDKYLYVSNYIRSDKIPLSNIKSVSDNVFFSPRPIFIEFKKDTEFGKKIMFLGRTTILFLTTHPAVKEIRHRIKMNQ